MMRDHVRQAGAALAVAMIAIDGAALVLLFVGVLGGAHQLDLMRAGLIAAATGFAIGTALQVLVLQGWGPVRLSRWRRAVKFVYLGTRVAVIACLLFVALR